MSSPWASFRMFCHILLLKLKMEVMWVNKCVLTNLNVGIWVSKVS